MFNGAKDPSTRAVELGPEGNVTEEQLDELERFFRDRGAKVRIVISDDKTARHLIRVLETTGEARLRERRGGRTFR